MLDGLFFGAIWASILGSENAQRKAAQREVQRMMRDEELQRSRFFEDEKRWRRDGFAFGDGLNTMQWNKILKLLDLIDDGYFPVCNLININNSEQEIKLYHLENYDLKKIHETPELVRVYMKLSDAEDYFNRGYSCSDWICPDRVFFKQLMSWDHVRELLESGKVLIGLPFGSGTEPKPMTTAEAREFMQTVMEERFQEHWRKHRDF